MQSWCDRQSSQQCAIEPIVTVHHDRWDRCDTDQFLANKDEPCIRNMLNHNLDKCWERCAQHITSALTWLLHDRQQRTPVDHSCGSYLPAVVIRCDRHFQQHGLEHCGLSSHRSGPFHLSQEQ